VLGKHDCITQSKVVWLKYTAPSNGWHQISSAAGTYLGVWESAACSPHGDLLQCSTYDAPNQAPVNFVAGKTYLIAIQTNQSSIVDPVIDIQPKTLADGDACQKPIDVTGSSFPLPITGNFKAALTKPGSCGWKYSNLWLKYTAATSGWHEFKLTNGDTTSSMSLAVLSGNCDSLSELVCKKLYSNVVGSFAELTAGSSYLVGMATSNGTDSILNPTVSITPVVSGPGDACSKAIDLTGTSFPHQVSGEFLSELQEGASCQYWENNMAWFKFTPSTSGWHDLSVKSDDATARLEMSLWDGIACNPHDSVLTCGGGATTSSVSAPVNLLAGKAIMFAVGTQSGTQRNLNPTIDLKPKTHDAGQVCATAIDLSAATMPFAIPASLNLHEEPTTACASQASNQAWFRFAPPSDGWYEVTVTHSANVAVGVAVYDGNGCNPKGPELSCDLDFSLSRTRVWMKQGSSYNILAHANTSSPWAGGTVSIKPSAPGVPGDSCVAPATVASTNHQTGPNGEHCWNWEADSTDTLPQESFGCSWSNSIGGDVAVEIETGPTQTALHYQAEVGGFQPGGYLAMEARTGSCTSNTCPFSTNQILGASTSGAIVVTPKTRYYLHLANGVAGLGRPKIDLCVW